MSCGARLLEHELAHRHLGALQRFGRADLMAGQRFDRDLLDRADRRRHHEDRQEQRDPDQHLVGRRVGGADRRADEAEHDQDAAEARDREEDRGHERQPADQQQDLDGVARVDVHLRTVSSRSRSSRLVPGPGEGIRIGSWLAPGLLRWGGQPRARRRRAQQRALRPRSRRAGIDHVEQPGVARLFLGVAMDRHHAVLGAAEQQVVVARLHQMHGAARAQGQSGDAREARARRLRVPAGLDLPQDPREPPDDCDHDREPHDRAHDAGPGTARMGAPSRGAEVQRRAFAGTFGMPAPRRGSWARARECVQAGASCRGRRRGRTVERVRLRHRGRLRGRVARVIGRAWPVFSYISCSTVTPQPPSAPTTRLPLANARPLANSSTGRSAAWSSSTTVPGTSSSARPSAM